MRYKIYQLSFQNGVHFGNTSLDESLVTFSADTLFSALFQEAIKAGKECADWLYDAVSNGSLLLSDAFPFIDGRLYLPKPMVRPDIPDKSGDSVEKKAFKKLKYIPMEKLGDYMKGELNAQKENSVMKKLAKGSMKTSAAIPEEDETRPYHIGTVYFGKGNGLYIITAVKSEEDESNLFELLDMLSFAGIGGQRASGLGRFEIIREKEIDSIHFEKDSDWVMALNICLPRDSEIEEAMNGAKYQMCKRSGFVASENYAPEQRKKKDLYMFTAGSCFRNRFEGDIFDVSDGGSHPVYRYGKPLFWAL